MPGTPRGNKKKLLLSNGLRLHHFPAKTAVGVAKFIYSVSATGKKEGGRSWGVMN